MTGEKLLAVLALIKTLQRGQNRGSVSGSVLTSQNQESKTATRLILRHQHPMSLEQKGFVGSLIL